jgi:hypothetical protein
MIEIDGMSYKKCWRGFIWRWNGTEWIKSNMDQADMVEAEAAERKRLVQLKKEKGHIRKLQQQKANRLRMARVRGSHSPAH